MTASSNPPDASPRVLDLDCLYASITNVSNFVSVKLSGDCNYHLWKAQMLCLMDSHNMRGIVDAAFVGPRSSSMEILRQYESLLKGWIFGSVSEDVLGTIVDLGSAKDVWEKLKSFFDPTMSSQQVPATENLQNSQTSARIDKWESKEDVALMSAWCLASEDKTRGKNQKRASLWGRVKQLYDVVQAENSAELSPRNENQIKGRWKRLNENANKWIAAYRESYRQKRSGMSLRDVENEAHAIYAASGSKFNDLIVFNEVMCKHPKWELQLDHGTTLFHPENEVGNEESGGSTKRSRTSEEGDYSVHVNQETPTGGGSTIDRPTGRDAAKRKGKCKVSQSSSSPIEFVAELRAMRITRNSEIELMSKKLELELKKEERELKKEERKSKKMYQVHLNTLLAKENLSPEDEAMKRHLLAMLYGK